MDLPMDSGYVNYVSNGHISRPAPQPRQDDVRKMQFTITIQSFGKGDNRHRDEIASALWSLLNRGFGADRVAVQDSNGQRIRFDPITGEIA